MATLAPGRTSARDNQAARARVATRGKAETAPATAVSGASYEQERRHAMISEAAYFLAARRHFRPGHELDDWLAAEREVDRRLSEGEDRMRAVAGPQALRYFENKLRGRSQALRTEIQETLLRTDNEQYARIAGEVRDAEEASLADLLVDVNLAEITRDVEEIRDIEAALVRVDTGVYGVCMTCEELIARERLEVYPTAKRCLACQRRYDQSRAVASPPSL